MLIEDLQKSGLSEAESRVYLAALELGETSISRLAKKSGIKRTTTYLVVEALQEKGLISTIKKDKKTRYYAEDPRKISEQLAEKQENVKKIMPELMAFANILDRKPKIRYFEGVEAYKEVFKDTLNYPKREALTWFSEDFIRFDEKFFLDYFVPKKNENRIWVRAIFPDTPKMRKYSELDQKHLRKIRFVPADKFAIHIEIILYGKNSIGFVAYDENLAIIIESDKIHEALKSIFEVMWDNANEQSQS